MRKFFVFLAVFCVTAAMITGCSREQGTEGQQSGADKGQSEVSSGDDSGISDERKIVFQADMVFAVNGEPVSEGEWNLYAIPELEKAENHEGTVIANGDTVNIDFVGKIDGVAFEGGSGEDYYLAVGSGQFIEDFEKGMPGHSIGETFDVTAVFPEDYQNDEYAGKTAVFTITANFFGKAKEGADDAYIARISGGMYNSLEEYKAEIKEYMSELAKDEYRSTAYGKVLDEMIAKSNFVEILDADVEYFENDIDRFYTSEAGNYGMSTEDYAMQVMGLDSMDAYLNSIHDQAIQVVKENMITDAIAKKENIVVTQELYEKGMQTYLDQISGATLADLEEYYTKDYLWEIVYQDMVDQKLFDKVSGN